MSRNLRPVIGWIADWFRTAWGLVIWNLRKSVFRLRQGASRCPCQNPSDSGRAWETRCDACFDWHRSVRFRRVCPLLKAAPDGSLRCSVDAADVRPFWGRCFGYLGGAAMAGWVLAAVAVFGGMRAIGYPVTLTAVAWPPAWGAINEARSSYFVQRAEAAYMNGRVNEAVMSLTLAHEYDPANYTAGLLLARIWQRDRAATSDELYRRLLADHAGRRPETARYWLRALLPRGDFVTIEQLAAAALRFDPGHATAWMHALLFANERTGNVDLLDAFQQPDSGLPAGTRRVLELESACRSGTTAQVRALLMGPLEPDAADFMAYFRVRRLVALGFPAEALDLLAQASGRLSSRDHAELSLLAYEAAGHDRLIDAAFDRVIAGPATREMIEVVCGHLIQHPHPGRYERFMRRLEREGPPGAAGGGREILARYSVAAVHRDEERAARLAELVPAGPGISGGALALAEAFFRRPQPERLPEVLPELQPLPLNINYALLARFGPRTHRFAAR